MLPFELKRLCIETNSSLYDFLRERKMVKAFLKRAKGRSLRHTLGMEKDMDLSPFHAFRWQDTQEGALYWSEIDSLYRTYKSSKMK